MSLSKFKLTHSLVCALSISLSLSQTGGYAEVDKQAGRQTKAAQIKPTKLGQLPIYLIHEWNTPYYVGYYDIGRLLSALFKAPSNELIMVSINDTLLKNKSESEINSLLVGPIGAKVKLTLVTTGGEKRVVNLVYEELPEFELVVNRTGLPALVEAMHPLDGDEGPFAVRRFQEMGKIYLEQYMDLLSSGADREALKLMSAWPVTSKYPVNQIAIQALSHALTAGNIKAADFFWGSVKDSLDFKGAPGKSIAENYPQVIVQLVQAGRRQEAILIARKLLPLFNGVQTDDSDSFDYADYRYRHDVLKSCAIALAVDSKIETLHVCDQLYELESDNQWLGEMFLSLGQKEKALACYKRALALEEKQGRTAADFSLRLEQIVLLERLSEILQSAGQDLESAEAMARSKLLRNSLTVDQITALGSLPRFNRREFNSTLNTSNTYALLNRAHSLIEQGTVPEKEIAELLRMYVTELPVANLQNHDCSVKKFFVLLNLVRDLSDHKMIEQSNQVLAGFSDFAKRRQNTQATALFLDAEAAINSLRSSDADVQKQKCMDVEAYLTPLSEFSADRFRILALAYSTAGDYKRAETILKYAEPRSLCEEKRHHNTRGRILTLLDKASLLNRLGHNSDAKKCFDQALSDLTVLNAQPLFSPSQNPEQAEIIEEGKEIQFRLSLTTKIIEAVKSDLEKNQLAEAQEKLRKALPLTDSDPDRSPARGYSRIKPQHAIRVFLARLLLVRGQIVEANDLLSQVEDNSWDNSFGDATVLKGDAAAASGNWSEAMERYLSVPYSGCSINPVNNLSSYSEFYLGKALEAAKKIPALSPSKLASIYQQLGGIYYTQPCRAAEAAELFKQAYELYPDSENKAIVADKIASAEKAILFYKARKDFAAGVTKGAVNLNSATVIMRLAEAARLAEKNITPNRVEQCFKLAEAEAEAGELNSAIAHARHATEMIYKPGHESEGDYGLSQRSAIFAITEKGSAPAAEELLILSAAKTKEICGYPSLEYEIQKANLFEFYLRQKQFDKALTVVDQILAVAPQMVELNRPQNDDGRLALLNSVPSIATDNSNPQLAQQILDKYLKASAKYYAGDDYRCAHLLKIKADLESKVDQAAAEADYRKALAIATLDANRYGEYSTVFAALEDFLTKNRKSAEVVLLRKERSHFDNSCEDCSSKAMSGQVINSQSEYFRISKLAPYSEYALLLLDTMLADFEEKHDKDSIDQYAPIAIDVLNHTNYFHHYFCRAQLIPLTARCRYLKMIIAADSQSEPKAAKLWLKKARDLKLPQATVEELTFLSQAELLCGNRQSALDFYKQACKLYTVDNNQDMHRDALVALRTKLGQRDELKSPTHQSGAGTEPGTHRGK